MKKKSSLMIMVLCCLGVFASIAAETPEYRLKVGDVLLVAIYGEDNTQREVVVDPRGMISFLFVDSLPASGKTMSEIRDALKEQLRKYYRFVTLSITPIKFNAEYYTITGELNNPGKKPIVGRPTILSAICQAGGFTTVDFRNQIYDMCNLEKAFIARNGEYLPIDFIKLVRSGDLTQDLLLEPGDYIYIPNRAVKQVFVLGEVVSPVSIDYMTSMSLIEALAEAGDVTERASSRVVVLRGSLSCPVRYQINYNRIVKGCACDFALHPGDIVYVPPRKLTLLREIVLYAMSAFVDRVALEVGTEAFIRTHPHAEEDLRNRAVITEGTTATASPLP